MPFSTLGIVKVQPVVGALAGKVTLYPSYTSLETGSTVTLRSTESSPLWLLPGCSISQLSRSRIRVCCCFGPGVQEILSLLHVDDQICVSCCCNYTVRQSNAVGRRTLWQNNVYRQGGGRSQLSWGTINSYLPVTSQIVLKIRRGNNNINRAGAFYFNSCLAYCSFTVLANCWGTGVTLVLQVTLSVTVAVTRAGPVIPSLALLVLSCA